MKNLPHEIVTGKRIYNEVSSRRFIDGLEEAIRITAACGRESGFTLQKIVGKRWIVYPDEILIGTSHSLGGNDEAQLYHLSKEGYSRETGRQYSGRSATFQEYQRFRHWRKQHNLHSSEPFPFDFSSSSDLRRSVLHQMAPAYPRGSATYILFDFHTHPADYTNMYVRFRPSFVDLNHLNATRKENEKMAGSPFSTIGILALVPTEKVSDPRVPLLFYQEKSPLPLTTQEIIKSHSLFQDLVLPRIRGQRFGSMLFEWMIRAESLRRNEAMPYHVHTADLRIGEKMTPFEDPFPRRVWDQFTIRV